MKNVGARVKAVIKKKKRKMFNGKGAKVKLLKLPFFKKEVE